MNAKEHLQYVRDLGLEIKAKTELCERLRDMAAISSPIISSDKVSMGQKQGSRMEEHIIKIMTIEHDMRYDTYKLFNAQNETMLLINEIKDPKEKALIINRYINGYSWEEIAKKMNYSESHTKGYAHKKALESFSEIFNINTH